MIHGASLDRSYSTLAMHAATYIRNRVWSNGADGVPYQLVTGLPPDNFRLRVFGCPCYVHIDKHLRRKLDDRAWKGVFLWATRWTRQQIWFGILGLGAWCVLAMWSSMS